MAMFKRLKSVNGELGDDVRATYIYHYPALSGYYTVDRVDRGDQTL
jgi:hypothetical protein